MSLARPRGFRIQALAFLVVAIGALGVLVWRAWPGPSNPGLRASFEALRASPVPVLVYVPSQPRETRAEVTSDGYVYTVFAEADMVMRGRRAQPGARFDGYHRQPGQIAWTANGTEYAVQARGVDAMDDEAVRDSFLPLDAAFVHQWGFQVDTPLLFLFYVPAFAGFTAWAAWLALTGDVPNRLEELQRGAQTVG